MNQAHTHTHINHIWVLIAHCSSLLPPRLLPQWFQSVPFLSYETEKEQTILINQTVIITVNVAFVGWVFSGDIFRRNQLDAKWENQWKCQVSFIWKSSISWATYSEWVLWINLRSKLISYSVFQNSKSILQSTKLKNKKTILNHDTNWGEPFSKWTINLLPLK